MIARPAFAFAREKKRAEKNCRGLKKVVASVLRCPADRRCCPSVRNTCTGLGIRHGAKNRAVNLPGAGGGGNLSSRFCKGCDNVKRHQKELRSIHVCCCGCGYPNLDKGLRRLVLPYGVVPNTSIFSTRHLVVSHISPCCFILL